MNNFSYDELFDIANEEGEVENPIEDGETAFKNVDNQADDDVGLQEFEENEDVDEMRDYQRKKRRSKKNQKRKEFLDVNERLSEEGHIIVNIQDSNKHAYISKITNVNFQTNENLFEKGRSKRELYEAQDKDTIPNIHFWNQRYYYFSKFDEGILLDYESWYSVTPEEISYFIAKQVENSTVVDAFCGSGGNTIQFSKHCKKVFSIDLDPAKIILCKNNCNVYNCKNNIEFITSDYLTVEPLLGKVDWVFLSPPWGGIEYKDESIYSLKTMIYPDIYKIIKQSLKFSRKLIFFLPRTTIIDEFVEILDECISSSTELETSTKGLNPLFYLDIKTLKSANKIKALLITCNFEDKEQSGNITNKDLRKYLKSIYPKAEEYQHCQLMKIAGIMDKLEFIRAEHVFRISSETENVNTDIDIFKEKKSDKSSLNRLLKFLKSEIANGDEVTEFKKVDKKAKGKATTVLDNEKMKMTNQKKCLEREYLISKENFQLLLSKVV